MEGEQEDWGSTHRLHMDALPELGLVGRGAPKPSPLEVIIVTPSLIGAVGRCSGARATPRGGSSGWTGGRGGAAVPAAGGGGRIHIHGDGAQGPAPGHT